VGVFGGSAPRELVSAAGMLPIPLEPERLEGIENGPEGLIGELSDGAAALLGALLSGALGWLDALLIGRDSEAHTKLFYVIREMAADAEFAPMIPPFAFSDVLRLPLRTSAVYNRIRLRQLAEVVSAWAEAQPDAAALRAAVTSDARTKRQLRELRDLQRRGLVTARDMLIAVRGAQVLPSADAQLALEEAVRRARTQKVTGLERPRIFVSGSRPEPDIYALLDSHALRVVGDDHEWDADDFEASAATEDPVDWLADRYQFNSPGAARAGLERVSQSVARVRGLEADAVLHLILPADEAGGWELQELRSRLPEVPVVSVQLDDGSGEEALRDAASSVRELLRRPAGSRQPSMGGTHA
jgi:2-hydroxyglutaryl-CoA dehydratase, D-component